MKLLTQIHDSVRFLQNVINTQQPEIAVILGTGLGTWVDDLPVINTVEMSAIPHWPIPTVEGHRGRLVLAHIRNHPVIFLQGRAHLYEGHSIQDVVYPVHVLSRLGIQSLIVTNAAGGMNPLYTPGDLMLVSDHINFMGTNPLIGFRDASQKMPFPDMSQPYDPELMILCESTARKLDIPLKKGILLACTGPSYETAAEIRMMQSLGADAVCMSTIPEVIVSVHLGMRILGISFITNLATGLTQKRFSHDDIEKTIHEKGKNFSLLIEKTIVHMVSSGGSL